MVPLFKYREGILLCSMFQFHHRWVVVASNGLGLALGQWWDEREGDRRRASEKHTHNEREKNKKKQKKTAALVYLTTPGAVVAVLAGSPSWLDASSARHGAPFPCRPRRPVDMRRAGQVLVTVPGDNKERREWVCASMFSTILHEFGLIQIVDCAWQPVCQWSVETYYLISQRAKITFRGTEGVTTFLALPLNRNSYKVLIPQDRDV